MKKLVIHRARVLAGVALVLSAANCKSPTEPKPQGVTILSGSGVSDTVAAFLPQALIVEVRDSAGRRLRGVAVRFQASVTGLGEQVVPTVELSASTPDVYREVAETVTDGIGRAAVRMRMGVVAGDAAILITVPTLESSALVELTVLPGATVRTVVMPRDTAVYVGASYTLRAATEDRYGNRGPATVAAATSDAPGIAAAANVSVTGQATGRTRIVATAGGAQQAAFVSVVPQGTLAAARRDGIYTFGLDGSGYRPVAAAPEARSPRWFPGGQHIVYSTGLGHAWVTDLNRTVRPLVAGANPLDAELWAHPSRDGQWVYFGGYAGSEFRGYPYRVRADGTGLQRVPGFAADDFTQGHPSPSPTGDRVAYFREEGYSRDVTLRVLEVGTGNVLLKDVRGHSPEWSHGDSIAYLDMQGGDRGPIRLMSSAGQGHRQVGSGTAYDFGIDWSPDDQWIVARDAESQRLEIIRVATGQRIPLTYSEGMYDPAWKP